MVATFETPHTETLLPGKLSRGSQAEVLANCHGLDPPMRALSLHREGAGGVCNLRNSPTATLSVFPFITTDPLPLCPQAIMVT